MPGSGHSSRRPRPLAALLLLAAASAAGASDAPFLWQVQGARATHCLAGSVHALPQNDAALPAGLERCYAAAGKLAFEAFGVAQLGRAEYVRMLGAIANNEPGGLRARLGRELHERFAAQVRRLGLEPVQFDAFRPWFAAQMLSSFLQIGSQLQEELGVDRQLYVRARNDRKDVLALESDEEHRAVFTGMPDEASTQFLMMVLDDAGEPGTGAQVVRIWRSGDAAALDQRVNRMREGYPQLYARLLTERNRRWLPRIRAMLNDAVPHLIVAGAAHYAGPDGLPALLVREGLRVQPLPPARADADDAYVPGLSSR
ncbi:MAG: TraB/GumN family protein [Gammaproteobacteria bacterium]|nr:TraB/GumN family protein [Gammaproteobacteria bacterium]